MTKRYKAYIKGFLPLFVLLGIFSCKKESSDIGVNLRPDGGAINAVQVSITDIVARTVQEDSLRTDSLDANVLGSLNDPIFGETGATLICQPLLPAFQYDFSGAVLDSIVLQLKYQQTQSVSGVDQTLVYGDLDDEITLDIYKIDEDLDAETRYYSNGNITLGSKIGTYVGKFMFYDSVQQISDGDTFMGAPVLRIRLDDAFGNEILSQPSLTFDSQDDFLNYLKGIALVPRMNHASGDGVMVALDVNSPSSNMVVYYNGNESKDFEFSTSSERINLYNISSPGVDLTDQFNGNGHYNTTYAQAMGAAKVKIDIPGLDSIIEKGIPVAINEAKLTFKVKSGTITSDYPSPVRLLLFEPNTSTGANVPIIDFIDAILPPSAEWLASSNYGGSFMNSSQSYEFHFNRFLQGLIEAYNETGVNGFNGFYLLIPSDKPITPSRVIFDTDPLNDGIQLSVSYTKLN
ncbi:MAG: DUF4270 family protein [Bacteroidia bacterium]